MRYLLFATIFILLANIGCNQPKKTDNQKAQAIKTVPVTKLPDVFYKRFEGSIGNKHIVLNLTKNKKSYNGNYYGDGSWIQLLKDSIIDQNHIVLFENNNSDYYFDQELKQPRMNLTWTNKGFDGTWISGKKDQKLALKIEEQYPNGSYTFSLYNYGDSIKAFPEKKTSPLAKINFTYLLATEEDANSKWLNSQLKKLNGIDDKQDVMVGLKKDAGNYLKDYQAEIKLIKSKPGAWMNYTDATVQNIQFNDRDFVVINNFTENYSGGAHGSYNSTFYCYDVKNRKKLKLADLMNIDSISLQKILEKNLRITYKLKPTEQLTAVLFDDFLKPNDNFYFNTNGVAFTYNPYEVASFAQGLITVFIPYADLKAYLNPVFSARIN